MQFGAVTFMLAETIFGKMTAEVTHHCVPRHFRDHTRGSDSKAEAIAIDDGGLRKRKWNHWQAIDQYVIRRNRERRDCGAHCLVCRAQNIDPINLDGIDNANRPAEFGISNQVVINSFAYFWRELFGVV